MSNTFRKIGADEYYLGSMHILLLYNYSIILLYCCTIIFLLYGYIVILLYYYNVHIILDEDVCGMESRMSNTIRKIGADENPHLSGNDALDRTHARSRRKAPASGNARRPTL